MTDEEFDTQDQGDPGQQAHRPEPPQPPAGEEEPADAADLLSRLQRVSADYLNYQKRAARELDFARQYANADLIGDILAVLDDMERALEAGAANHPADDPLLTGMQLVYRKALDVLGKHGVVRIESEGKVFDPTLHEAMMQQPAPEAEVPTVLQELQRGYRLHDRVIRPARVIVGMPAEADQAEEAEEDQADRENQ